MRAEGHEVESRLAEKLLSSRDGSSDLVLGDDSGRNAALVGNPREEKSTPAKIHQHFDYSRVEGDLMCSRVNELACRPNGTVEVEKYNGFAVHAASACLSSCMSFCSSLSRSLALIITPCGS